MNKYGGVSEMFAADQAAFDTLLGILVACLFG